MVEKLKKELLESIDKYGINDKRTYELSKKLDEAINIYYQKYYKKDKRRKLWIQRDMN